MLNKDQFADNHFIRTIIEEDLKSGKHEAVQTRFPPEPNGYLHIGHAKSICLNFGLAYIFDGLCNLRFDDTNPEKENDEYVNAIKEDVEWLGFHWAGEPRFASNYFDQLYDYAVGLIKDGKAYVDDLTPEEMREYRGTLTEAGKNSPYRDRSVEENLDLFTRMKNGEFPDGSKTLRLKIDMASGNINMRDPVIYRIRRAHHHNTGDKWCIYPMYDYTHCISDAIEGITHSLCTLEFEAHRPLYDWVLDNIPAPHATRPRQYEFSRLELLYSITSKRKLNQLVSDGHVTGWDDPRLAALDIQWADLRPGCSVVDKLDAAGRIHRLVTEAEVERAADRPPEGTRATIRGTAINRHPQIVGASWTCLVLDVPGRPELLRLRLPDDVAVGPDETATILEEIGRRAAPERH